MNRLLCKDAGVSIRKPADFECETDYRLAALLSASKNLQGRRVALYGSGANAHYILDAEGRCFDVVAIADDNAIGETVDEFVVSSLEAVLSQGIDALIVAAKFTSALAVISRIRERCFDAGVRLLDMYGNDCEAIEALTQRAIAQSLESKLEEIESSNSLCVSIGLLIGAAATMEIAKCIRNQVDISECLSSILAYELAKGKKVAYYCVDPAVDKKTALSLLEQAGLANTGPLFLAAETDSFAENGLYRLMYRHLPSGATVHIGMDILRDCYIPLCYGKRSVLTSLLEVPNGIRLEGLREEIVPRGIWYEDEVVEEGRAPDDRLLSCARAVLPDISDAIDKRSAKVVAIVAPLVVGFVTWLADCFAKSPEVFEEALFVSRDGFLVKGVYDIFRSQCAGGPYPLSRYFYTSRNASRAAIVSTVERDNSLSYFASCGLGLGKTYAFVEFVGAGTCQRQLERFAPFCLKGFYFGSRIGNNISRKLTCSLYFDSEHVSFFSRYLVLEPYLSSTEPSLKGFDDDGTPVFSTEYRTSGELRILQDVHKGVKLFAREYFRHWYEKGDVISPAFLNAIMPYLDLCDTDSMTLVDDLSGRVLTKRIDELIPLNNPVGDAAASDDAVEGDVCMDGNQIAKRDITYAMLELLDVFDAVCEEFDLKYVATHGTLLGAVREGGFVSGDDDIDVAMPRADYDRLTELAACGVFPEPFVLQTPENDAASFTGGYAKLRNLSAIVERSENDKHSEEEGVWIDILPLDNCPLDDAEVEKRQRIVRTWQRLLYAKTYDNLEQIWDADPHKVSAYFLLADLVSRSALCRGLRASCTAVKPTGLLTCFTGNYRRRPNHVRFAEADIAHAVRVSFEGTTIPVPGNAEKWLDLYYGDSWREPHETSSKRGLIYLL